MLEIIGSTYEQNKTMTLLEQKTIDNAVKEAIRSIKKELPEEAQTVEVMEYVIAELHVVMKQSKVVL